MSARFTANFLVLLLGAALLVVVFAFSTRTLDAVALGVGAASVLIALSSFALPHQGAYQRIADVAICLVGAWMIVAARAISYHGRWLQFAAGLGLTVLGAVGLVVRELVLSRGLQVGEARIGPDQFVQLSALQRDAGVQP